MLAIGCPSAVAEVRCVQPGFDLASGVFGQWVSVGVVREMGMDLFVTIDRNASDWRFDPANFVDQLSKDWPSAKVRVVTSQKSPASHHWSIRLTQSAAKTLDGVVTRTGDLVSLEGSLEDSAPFVLWVRRVVPQEVPLKLFSDQHPHQMFITPQTSVSSIIEAFQ